MKNGYLETQAIFFIIALGTASYLLCGVFTAYWKTT